MKGIYLKVAAALSMVCLGTYQATYASAAIPARTTHAMVSTTTRAPHLALSVESKLIIHDTQDPTLLTAKVMDSQGHAINAAMVKFSVLNKNVATLIKTSAITNGNGIASTDVVPGVRIGTTKVRATYDGINQTVNVSTVVAPTKLIVNPKSATIVENTNAPITFTVKALNSNGTLAAGIPVDISQILSSGRTSVLKVTNEQWITNAHGIATFNLSDVGYATGTEGISANVGQNGKRSAISTFTVVAGVDALKSVITSRPKTMTVGRPYNVHVTVKDSHGQPVSHLDRQAFRLDFPDAAAQTTWTATRVRETSAGKYIVSFVADDGSGTNGAFQYGNQLAQLIVNDTNVGAEKTINVVPESPKDYPSNGDTISLVSTPHNLALDNGWPIDRIEYIVRDKNGNPAPGVRVFFSSSNTNIVWFEPLFNMVNGVSTPIVTTNQNGEIYADASTGGKTGAVQVSAAIAGGTAAKSSIRVLNPIGTVTLTASRTTLSAADSTPITVTVTATDANGNPLSDVGLFIGIGGSYGVSASGTTPFDVSNNVVYTDDTGHGTFTVTPDVTATSAPSYNLMVGNFDNAKQVGTLTFTVDSTGSTTPTTPAPNVWSGYQGDVSSNVAIAGNLAIVSDSWVPRSLYAYDVSTGKRVWQYTDPNTSHVYMTSILAGDASIVVEAKQNELRAFAQNSGTVIWGPVQVGSVIAMTVSQGNIFVITSENKLLAIDETTGNTVWSQSLNGTPVVLSTNGNQVVVGTSSGNVVAYSYSGTLDFNATLSTDSITGLVMTNNDWLVSQNDKLTCLDSTGNTVWNHAFAVPLAGGNVAVDGSTIYAATNDSTVTTLDSSNGNVINSGKTDFAFAFTPAALSGKLYGSNTQGSYYVVDGSTLQTIQLISKYDNTNGTPEDLNVVSSPVIAGSNILVQTHQLAITGDVEVVAFATQ